MKPKPQVKNVEAAQSEAATVETLTLVDDQVNKNYKMIKQHRICDTNYDSD